MEQSVNHLVRFDSFNNQIVVLDFCDGKDLHIKSNGDQYLVRSGVEGFFQVPDRLVNPSFEALDALLEFIHNLPYHGRYAVCLYNSCTLKK